MKKGFLLILLFYCFDKSFAQNNQNIDFKKLTSLAERSVFTEFVSFTSSLEYIVLDSSKLNNGSTIYFTREPWLHGNTLACSTDPSWKKMELLTFRTYNKEAFIALKDQLVKSGYKASKVKKAFSSPEIESQDFEKGKFLVAAVVSHDKDAVLNYEFTFMKW